MVHFVLKKNFDCLRVELKNISLKDIINMYDSHRRMIYVLDENKLIGVISESEIELMRESNSIIYNRKYTYYCDLPDTEEKVRECFCSHMNWKAIPIVDSEGDLLYEYFFDQREFYDGLIIEKMMKDEDVTKEMRIIVSLTSHGKRLKTVYLTIKSLLYQTRKPDEIVLYIDEDSDIDRIEQEEYLLSMGVKIVRGVENLKCYTKYYYAMTEYRNDLIITVDDDFFYDDMLIDDLYMAHKQFPNTVICRYGERIKYVDGMVAPYEEWNDGKQSSSPENQICVKGFAGVLYPVGEYREMMLDKSEFLRLSPLNDDLWITTCLQEQGIFCFTLGKKPIWVIDETQEIGLWNSEKTPQRNDKYVKNICQKYNRAFKCSE